MRIKFLISLVIISSLISCQQSDWKNDNRTIRPINGVTDKHFNLKTFVELDESQINDHNFWLKMNHSPFEFGVKIENGELIIAEPILEAPFFELENGKLDIINRGEFGGALNFIPDDSSLDTISILEGPINYMFNFKNKTYFATKIELWKDYGGAIFELSRKGNKFNFKDVVRLDSPPEAIAIYKNKIFIAGHRMFTVIENFKKENVIENAFWGGLYPNSIAVKNENEIYVGMRGGYSILSLRSKEVKYFKYNER